MISDIKCVAYNNRDERNKFVAEKLSQYLGRSILNVGGGGEKFMKKYLKENVEYFELDIVGSPDLKIDLEKQLPIPVNDNSYETVICTDVLEHLDNFHEVFDEIVRISKDYIIISLPNPVASRPYVTTRSPERSEIRAKQYGRYYKFNGLPFEKPVDRHKWFFSYTEAEDFMNYQANKKSLSICESFGVGCYSGSLFKDIIKSIILFYSKDFFHNSLCHVYWVVLKKNKSKSGGFLSEF